MALDKAWRDVPGLQHFGVLADPDGHECGGSSEPPTGRVNLMAAALAALTQVCRSRLVACVVA